MGCSRKYQVLRKRAVAELAGRTYVERGARAKGRGRGFAAQIPKMHGAPRPQVRRSGERRVPREQCNRVIEVIALYAIGRTRIIELTS
jgi:hypothetical protein